MHVHVKIIYLSNENDVKVPKNGGNLSNIQKCLILTCQVCENGTKRRKKNISIA